MAPPVESLAELNFRTIAAVNAYLGISTPLVMASALDFQTPAHCAPGEWALHIAKHLKASEYRNAAGGVELFDEAQYAKAGIKLTFHAHEQRRYLTGSLPFVEGLSVIDWMMWNDPIQLREWLAESPRNA